MVQSDRPASFFAKVIVQELPPLTLVCIRFAIAAGALWAYLRASRTPVPRSLPAWAAFAGMGALNNLIPAGLITWSQQTIASGLASVLIATTPVFSILIAHGLTLDEKLSANKMGGVALGIAGTAALVGVGTLDGSGRAILATVGCLSRLNASPWAACASPRADWPLVLGIGLLQMALFTALVAVALGVVPAGRAALLAYTTPVWVLPLAAALLGEQPGTKGMTAIVLCLGGVASGGSPPGVKLPRAVWGRSPLW